MRFERPVTRSMTIIMMEVNSRPIAVVSIRTSKRKSSWACRRVGRPLRGLPVGLQVVAPRYQDRRVLAIAQVLESLLDLNLVPVNPS